MFDISAAHIYKKRTRKAAVILITQPALPTSTWPWTRLAFYKSKASQPTSNSQTKGQITNTIPKNAVDNLTLFPMC